MSELQALVLTTLVAALLTDFATGLGALPFFFVRKVSRRWQGRFAALAGGMMLSASVFNLSGEALKRGATWEVAAGILSGALFLSAASRLVGARHWKISSRSEEASRISTEIALPLI